MSSSSWTPPAGYESRPIAILGGGVLGRRIGACWAAGGYDVNIRDPNAEQRKAAVEYINSSIPVYAKYLSSPKTPGKAQAFEDVKTAVENAWIVFEAVPENLEIKIDTYAELQHLAPQDCILASNSSSYKSSQMLAKVDPANYHRILNTHYMMPPELRVVELMTDGHTAQEIFPFLVEKHREVGLTPFVARKESTGFIFNRVWAAIKREILNILDEGVSTPEELDAIWIEMYANRKAGPCQLMDAVGLDTVAFIEQHYIHERGLPTSPVEFLQKHYLSQGKLGLKSSKGGLYPPKSAAPTKEPQVLVLDVGLAHPTNPLGGGRILSFSPSNPSPKAIASGLALPDGISYSPTTHRIYWTNMGIPNKPDGSIQSANLDGSDIRTVLPAGDTPHTPKQLVVDAQPGQPDVLYFSDREGLRVWRCQGDGSGLECLVRNGDWRDPAHQSDQMRWCVGIAVSRRTGHFYWTQKGFSKSGRGKILRARLDMPAGATCDARPDVEVLVQGLPEPIDLEIDEEAGELWWTDRGELPWGNTLNAMRVEDLGVQGKQHRIVARGFHEAIGLSVVRDGKGGRTVWVADLGGAVYAVDVDGEGRGRKRRVYEEEGAAFTGVTVVGAAV